MKHLSSAIIAMLLAALFLVPALALAASYDPFVPNDLITKINDRMPITVEAFGMVDFIEEYSAYLKLDFTDQDGGVLYYDNTDWNVELAFAYAGDADQGKSADGINIVLSNSLDEDYVMCMLSMLSEAFSADNDAMDENALYDFFFWDAESESPSTTCKTAIGTFTRVDNPDAIQFTLFKNDGPTAVVTQQTVEPQPTPTPAPAPAQSADNLQVLYDKDGIKIELLRISPRPNNYFPTLVRFHVLITNNSGKKINVVPTDATVNGERVEGVGFFDIKDGTENQEEYFFLHANNLSAAAVNAICNPRTATLTLEITRSGNILGSQTVTIDMSSVPSFTPLPTEEPTPKPTAKPTTKPTSTPKPSSSTSYNKQKIQWLDFSDRQYAQWQYESGNRLKVRFEVSSFQYPVHSFKLYVYAENFMGVRIWGDDFIYYWTTKRDMTSYRTAFSDYVTLPDRKSIHKVWCGIKEVTLRDGTVEEIPDSDVIYYDWVINQ